MHSLGFGAVALLVLGLGPVAHALNILIHTAAIGHSHVQFAGKIADVLIDGGHNVTILQVQFDPDVTEPGSKVAHTIKYVAEHLDYSVFLNMSCKFSGVFSPNRKTASDVAVVFYMKKRVCDAIVHDDALWEQLKSTKFDIAMAEFVDYCQDGIFEVLGIDKVVMLSAVTMFNPTYEAFGIPFISSFMPNMFLPYSDRMNWRQKLMNLLVNYKLSSMYKEHMEAQTAMFRSRYGAAFDDLLTLRKRKMSLAFLNVNENLDMPTLITNKVKYIGGLRTKNPAPISADLEAKIANSRGFVLLSFGTFARSKAVPEHVRQAIGAAFRHFPEFQFFWKFDTEGEERPDFLGNATNIHLASWLPQHALLNHPKCRAFITHAGYNSMLEAVAAAVPMILVPLFGDQPHNAAVAAERGLGILLGRENLHQVGLTLALKEMLQNAEAPYHANVAAFAARMKAARAILSPEQTVLRYTEYVHAHGTLPDLHLASADMSFWEVYLLDVLGAVTVGATGVLALLAWLLRKLWRKFVSGYAPGQDKPKSE